MIEIYRFLACGRSRRSKAIGEFFYIRKNADYVSIGRLQVAHNQLLVRIVPAVMWSDLVSFEDICILATAWSSMLA